MTEADITFGQDEGIIALMVHHLPMLKVLRLSAYNLGDNVLWDLFEQVAIGYGSDRAEKMPFQRLGSAAVGRGGRGGRGGRDDRRGSIPHEWALHFNSIPSLRTFAADRISVNMEVYGEEEGQSQYPGDLLPFSNAKEICFTMSSRRLPSTREIL